MRIPNKYIIRRTSDLTDKELKDSLSRRDSINGSICILKFPVDFDTSGYSGLIFNHDQIIEYLRIHDELFNGPDDMIDSSTMRKAKLKENIEEIKTDKGLKVDKIDDKKERIIEKEERKKRCIVCSIIKKIKKWIKNIQKYLSGLMKM